jgi:rod shape-determining protein MreD
MKQSVVYLVGGLVALLLQTTIFSHLPIKPDFVLILVVSIALSQLTFAGAVLAFLLGCLTDVFAGSTPGFFTLTKTVVFFLVYSTRGRLYFESYLSKAALVLLIALIEGFMLMLLVHFTSGQSIFSSPLGRLVVGPAVFTALVSPACFAVLQRIKIHLT